MKKTRFLPVLLTFLLLLPACGTAEVMPENKAEGSLSQEGWQKTTLHFFERLEAGDKDDMQTVFRGIDRLFLDASDENYAYLKGVIEGINHTQSPYYVLTCSAPQEMIDSILSGKLAAAFETAFDAETAFISAIQTNVHAAALSDPHSELRSLMPNIWKSLENLYRHNLYSEDLNQEAYAEALLTYASLMKDATVLIVD